MCMCNFAYKGRPRNVLFYVRRDVKHYSLTHSLINILQTPLRNNIFQPNLVIFPTLCWKLSVQNLIQIHSDMTFLLYNV